MQIAIIAPCIKVGAVAVNMLFTWVSPVLSKIGTGYSSCSFEVVRFNTLKYSSIKVLEQLDN